jgi:hypothetical protein
MNFIDDNDYQSLRKKFEEPNIFFILNNASYEIRHSNFLSWLLDPNQNHRQSDYFLGKLISDLGYKNLFSSETVKVERETEHIDLIIYDEHNILAIENKTRTRDSDGQLARYRKFINSKFPDHKKHFVYWTLNGEDPTDIEERVYWQQYSHQNFLKILIDACDKIKDLRTKTLIQDYIDALQLGLLPSDKYSSMAKRLLLNYRSELSQVFSNMPSLSLADVETVKFLQRNSSFVKGNGFFSTEKPFVVAFEKACESLDYFVVPRGKKQTTYFGFRPKSLHNFFLVRGINRSIPCSFSCRFYDEKHLIVLKFGLDPETPENARYRQLILASMYEIYEAKIGIKILRSGKKHTGLVKLEIPFDTMNLEKFCIDRQIETLFESNFKDFVSEITLFLVDILEKQEGSFKAGA